MWNSHNIWLAKVPINENKIMSFGIEHCSPLSNMQIIFYNECAAQLTECKAQILSHTHSASISITSATLLTEMWYDFTLNLFRFEKFGMFRWARIRNKNQLYLIHQFQCEIYIHHRGNSFYFRFQMGMIWMVLGAVFNINSFSLYVMFK